MASRVVLSQHIFVFVPPISTFRIRWLDSMLCSIDEPGVSAEYRFFRITRSSFYNQFLPHLFAISTGLKRLNRAFLNIFGHEIADEVFPVALAVRGSGGTGDPDNQAAQIAQFLAQPVNGFADAAGGRHFRRRAWLAEHILHIDNDKRCFRRIERIIKMMPPAAGEHPIDNFLPNGDRVNHTGLFGRPGRF